MTEIFEVFARRVPIAYFLNVETTPIGSKKMIRIVNSHPSYGYILRQLFVQNGLIEEIECKGRGHCKKYRYTEKGKMLAKEISIISGLLGERRE